MHVFISRKGNFLSHQFQFYEIMQMQIFVIYHCSLSSMSITITMSWYVACLFFVYFYNKCLHVLCKEYLSTAWNVPNIFLWRFLVIKSAKTWRVYKWYEYGYKNSLILDIFRAISRNRVWWIPDKILSLHLCL